MKELKRLLTNYTFIDILRLIRDKILTIFFFNNNVRIVRHPFYIIGKKNIQFGKDFQSGPRLRIEIISSIFARHPINLEISPTLIIGNNVSFNYNVHIGVIKKIIIGDNVLLGSNISIVDHNHGIYSGEDQDSPKTIPRDRKAIPEEVFIGNNVWVADNVVILPGTIINDGCIVGANAVVKGRFSKNQIIVGNPAKAIKKYNDQKEVWEVIK